MLRVAGVAATLRSLRQSIFCGSPQSVVRQMRRVRDALGNGRFNINMKIGNIPDAAVHRGMELFRDQVLPEAKGL